MEEKFQNELRYRRRTRGESIRELAQDIQRLMALAYPGEKSSLSEHIARDAFLSSLDDAEFELKIREREPADLDTAVKLALRFEVFRSTVDSSSHARHRVTRKVTEDAEANTSSSDLEVRLTNLERQLTGPRIPAKTECEQNGSQQEVQQNTSFVKQTSDQNRRPRRGRAVNVADQGWKDEMTKRIEELQLSHQSDAVHSAAQSERLIAENDALNKEVGRLRHLEQMRSTPTWRSAPASNQMPKEASAHQPRPAMKQPFYCYNCGQA